MTAIDPEALQEVLLALQHGRTLLDELVVRGVRAAGPADWGRLEALGEELERVGARHLGDQLGALLGAMKNDDPGATGAVLRAQTSLVLFDRVLTLRVVEASLAAVVEGANA
jgi:hypothetical protein